MTDDIKLTSYEVSLLKCPHCSSKLEIISISKYLKTSIENVISMSAIHLNKCPMNNKNKKIATIKINITEESKSYTSKKSETNLIII